MKYIYPTASETMPMYIPTQTALFPNPLAQILSPGLWGSGSKRFLSPYTSRQKLRDRLQNAATRAQQAIAAETRGDHKEAIRLWGIELGEEFPSYN
jgi:hypothetical protein